MKNEKLSPKSSIQLLGLLGDYSLSNKMFIIVQAE